MFDHSTSFLISILILIKSFTANAEEIIVQQTLTLELCQQLLSNHVAAKDVEYQSGIDVYGNSVTPADLEGSIKIDLPKKITIPLRLHMQKFLDTSQNMVSPLKEQADLGTITLHQDGRLYYNDQPLFNEDQQVIEQACRKIM